MSWLGRKFHIEFSHTLYYNHNHELPTQVIFLSDWSVYSCDEFQKPHWTSIQVLALFFWAHLGQSLAGSYA